MKHSIYTHTGDKGTTGLIGGTRIRKSDKQLEAYGTVDELNAEIGLLRTYIEDAHDSQMLLSIQHRLFVVGSILASDPNRIDVSKIGKISAENVKQIEEEIDAINAKITELRSFVIPGGCRAAAIAHICRTVCRRAERRIYAFTDEQHPVSKEVLEFVNRLSDYFFILSRKVNSDNKTDEILWDNTCI